MEALPPSRALSGGAAVLHVDLGGPGAATTEHDAIEIPGHSEEAFHEHISGMSRNELLHLIRHAIEASVWHENINGVKCSGTYLRDVKHCAFVTCDGAQRTIGWLGTALSKVELRQGLQLRAYIRTNAFIETNLDFVHASSNAAFPTAESTALEIVTAVRDHDLELSDLVLDHRLAHAQSRFQSRDPRDTSTLYVELLRTPVSDDIPSDIQVECTGQAATTATEWAAFHAMAVDRKGGPLPRSDRERRLLKLAWTFPVFQWLGAGGPSSDADTAAAALSGTTQDMYVLYSIYTPPMSNSVVLSLHRVVPHRPWYSEPYIRRVPVEVMKVLRCNDAWTEAQVEFTVDGRLDSPDADTRRMQCLFMSSWMRAGFNGLKIRRVGSTICCTLTCARDVMRFV